LCTGAALAHYAFEIAPRRRRRTSRTPDTRKLSPNEIGSHAPLPVRGRLPANDSGVVFPFVVGGAEVPSPDTVVLDFAFVVVVT
jgi:hypothetical protein